MKLDERNQSFFKNHPFFISMATAAKFVLPIPIFWLLSFLQMWMWQETLLQNFVKFGVNLTFFAPW
jgi:hypothetical protein